jgi:hypothetical protein
MLGREQSPNLPLIYVHDVVSLPWTVQGTNKAGWLI